VTVPGRKRGIGCCKRLGEEPVNVARAWPLSRKAVTATDSPVPSSRGSDRPRSGPRRGVGAAVFEGGVSKAAVCCKAVFFLRFGVRCCFMVVSPFDRRRLPAARISSRTSSFGGTLPVLIYTPSEETLRLNLRRAHGAVGINFRTQPRRLWLCQPRGDVSL
jgi:hypothetical protein